jgi:hypothetical protein
VEIDVRLPRPAALAPDQGKPRRLMRRRAACTDGTIASTDLFHASISQIRRAARAQSVARAVSRDDEAKSTPRMLPVGQRVRAAERAPPSWT